ncbi:hypothetical protein EV385_6325 [Krasilnikovia cinnamomea]|uniref:MYXO-CTERM domain-containing protein n=1 Tax=Krasilnikovia cinnamomea TaxID=349313 RepID=A0A4Q7ZTV2_9ACTN|nr:hypothetical protein [Krasilnikovia cinnamomea]RZU54374.1 hypothetical protein EV385_6325 [Krasilnikovia cinnamomea]
MTLARFRRSGPLLMAAGTLAAVLTPGVALADGPGYGGTADALTVQWEGRGNNNAGRAVAIYAVGFRGGSSVAVRVGSAPERKVTADAFGGLRVVLVAAGRKAGAAARSASGVGAAAGFGSAAMVGAVPGPASTPASGTASAAVDAAAVEAAVGAKVPPGTVVVAMDTPTGGELSSGTVVQAIGQSPAGSVRTLVGAVPPPAAGGGVHTLVPWSGFAAVLVGIGVLLRRRLRPARPAAAGDVRRHRYAPRHR